MICPTYPLALGEQYATICAAVCSGLDQLSLTGHNISNTLDYLVSYYDGI
jgi:hypothetical protein